MNLIYGKNAQGKTNLLESIWTMTGCKNFRGNRERDLIGFQEERMGAKMVFQDSSRTQTITYCLVRPGGKEHRSLKLNGVPLSGMASLFQAFQCVLFTPSDTELVTGTPEKRRVFLDCCCCQAQPKILPVVRKFDVLMNQRNAMLKQLNSGLGSRSQLDIWDEQLAVAGAYLSLYRYQYLRQFAMICKVLYRRISNYQEDLLLHYRSNVFSEEDFPQAELQKPTSRMAAQYLRRLQETREDDIRLGYTSCGAGRDDFTLHIGAHSVREFGSQGQCKSAALIMKLAQAEMYRDRQGESPVVLLDDVMGELDLVRQRLIYQVVKKMQVFITTCSPESLDLNDALKVRFYVEGGRVTRV